MILICENCQARYLVPGHAVGAEGRRVRCTSCGHEWFQEPEEKEERQERTFREELEEEIEIEPIPESVRPVPEGSSVPVIQLGDGTGRHSGKARLAGYAAAAAVAVAIGAAFFSLHNTVAKLWPASMALYDLAGIETRIDGEDLIFDGLKAVAEVNEHGVQTLTVEANILNLARTDSRVPLVQTSLIMANGEVIDSWLTEPPQKMLAAQGETLFRTTYPEVPKDVKEVNVRFVPGSEVTVKEGASAAPEPAPAPVAHESAPPEQTHH